MHKKIHLIELHQWKTGHIKMPISQNVKYGNCPYSTSVQIYEEIKYFYWNINTIKKCIWNLPAPLPATENGCDTKLFDLAKSVHWIVEDGAINSSLNSAKRRRRLGLTLDGSDDEDTPLPPSNDIYRQRQQKKVKS